MVLCFLSKLRGVEFEVVCKRENFGFCVEVLDVGIGGASDDDSESGVLDRLKLLDVGCRCYWGPDCAGVFKNWSDYGFVGGKESFFLLTPCCGS